MAESGAGARHLHGALSALQQHNLPSAAGEAAAALEQFTLEGDATGAAAAHQVLAMVAAGRGDLRTALAHVNAAKWTPASPPVIVVIPTFEAMPSTSALPLICTPGPNTISARRSVAASSPPIRAPAASESAIPRRGDVAVLIRVPLKFTAVMTQLPSATPFLR